MQLQEKQKKSLFSLQKRFLSAEVSLFQISSNKVFPSDIKFMT